MDDAAWIPWTRLATAVERAVAVDSSGGAPRERSRRPGASSRRGARAPSGGVDGLRGDRERGAEGEAEVTLCHPHGCDENA